MSSGAGFVTGAGGSCCLRALPAIDLALPIAFEFGSVWGIGRGRGGALRGGGDIGPGGGEPEGSGEGGDREVMSTDGERGRPVESLGLGGGESSGAGGGGSTKWNVREAIWICDLPGYQLTYRHTCGLEGNYRSLRETLVPLPHHAPSTQAPFLPSTTRTKCSSSSSYSIRAWRRETLLRGPRSTSTCVFSDEEAVDVGMQRRPIVTLRVWR